MKDAESLKETKPDWYWQITSNCILTNRKQGELVVYCPYKDELKEIRDYAGESSIAKFAFISFLEDDELPYLIEGKHYKNLNIFRWDVPREDIDLLTEAVTKATQLLKGEPSEG